MTEHKRGDRPGYNLARPRPLRSDARANRERILSAAADAFDREGLDVSLDQIARLAGVGPGTLHRHFATKAALIDATLADRVASLSNAVEAYIDAHDPTTALVEALSLVVEEGAASHALAERLRSGSGDIDVAVAKPAAELRTNLATLLTRAQDTGSVNPDLDQGSLDALLAAAHTLRTHPLGGAHLVDLLWAAIRR